MEMDDAIHTRMVGEDDTLRLSANAGFASIGHHAIWSVRFDVDKTNILEVVEIGFAPRSEELSVGEFDRKMARSFAIESLVRSAINAMVDDFAERTWYKFGVPGNRIARDNRGAGESEMGTQISHFH